VNGLRVAALTSVKTYASFSRQGMAFGKIVGMQRGRSVEGARCIVSVWR
jgi:hypothetical protein